MAIVSNVNRRAAAKAIVQQIDTLKTIIGIAVQTHRAYEFTGRNNGNGLRQEDVAAAASQYGPNVSQGLISQFENGAQIPSDPRLENILRAAGFHFGPNSGGSALLAVLQAIRDHQDDIVRIVTEQPG